VNREWGHGLPRIVELIGDANLTRSAPLPGRHYLELDPATSSVLVL
jgi:hypothetical protein